MIRVAVDNLRYTPAAGMQLHLIKNHVEFKLVRVPQIASRARWHDGWVDDAPPPFKTSNCIAILSLGDPITQPDSVLDRRGQSPQSGHHDRSSVKRYKIGVG